MTRNTERQRLLKVLEKNVLYQFIMENERMMQQLVQDDLSDSDDEFDSFSNAMNAAMMYITVHSNRYIHRQPHYREPDLERALHLLNNARPRHFLSKVRMSKDVFLEVVAKFASSDVFRPASNRVIPVMVQFLIAFHRFGTYGNGINYKLVADYFGLSGKRSK